MEDLLNTYQKNFLRIVLLGFEENLRHAQTWLDGYEENGILYSRRLILPEGHRQQALQEIKTALGLIEKLSQLFDLPQEITNSATSILRGDLTVNWANLYDARAKKLAGYGEVHPDLAGLLDADIENLAEIAWHLSTILGEDQQEKP